MRPHRESKLVRVLLGGFFLLVGGYALYAGWGTLSGPAIEIVAQSVTTEEQYFLVTGVTKRITELHLNGTRIPVTEAGIFEEPYLLAPGSNRLVLEARDARGRIARELLDIAYVPTEFSPLPFPVPAPTTTPESEGV